MKKTSIRKKGSPNILLVNPWIHDFAAYDFWAKPIGLLYLAAILRSSGFNISYIDCLDRFHPKTHLKDSFRYGKGPYLKTRIEKPAGLKDINRNYSRYGIFPEWLKEDLETLPRPDLILITSLMTYWYPGVKEIISFLKEFFPGVFVVLGGVYARLCTDHARANCGADLVIDKESEELIIKLAEDLTGYKADSIIPFQGIDSYPYPAFDLQNKVDYIPLLTSRGCPYSCDYCASSFLRQNLSFRSPENVLKEIIYWHEQYHVVDFAFYDDALLVNAKEHIIPILKGIINSGIDVRFHTPNALHINRITYEIACLMFKAGFINIRIGLETADFDDIARLDRKINQADFIKGVENLIKAGFKKEQIGAYLLIGLPNQNMQPIESSIIEVKKRGISPILAYYTPIPHTRLWKTAVDSSRYDVEKDPVFTNNAIFPCQKGPFSWEKITYLKKLLQT